MSVMNDLLKDLDRRNAPNPIRLNDDIVDDHLELGDLSRQARSPAFTLILAAIIFVIVIVVLAKTLINPLFFDESSVPKTFAPNVSGGEQSVSLASVKPTQITDAFKAVQSAGQAGQTFEITTSSVSELHNEETPRIQNRQSPAIHSRQFPELSSGFPEIKKREVALDETLNDQRLDEQRALANQWIELGNIALQKDHLTQPSKKSAWSYYLKASELVSDHPGVLLGMENIRSRYRVLLKDAAKLGRRRLFDALTQSALITGLNEEEIAEYSLTLDRKVTVSENVGRSAEGLSKGNQADIVLETSSEAIKFEAQKSSENTQPFTLSEASKESKVLSDVENKLVDGDWVSARDDLAKFIARYPNAQRATHEFLKLEFTHNPDIFSDVLTQRQEQLSRPYQDYWQAKVLQSGGRYDDALAQLGESSNSKVLDDYRMFDDYRVLRAGLCYRLGRYQCSAKDYQSLVENNKEAAIYWFGLAVSLESLSNFSAAIVSYRRAVLLADDEANFRIIAQQKIADLDRSYKAAQVNQR